MNNKDELICLSTDFKYDIIAPTEIYPKIAIESDIFDLEWNIEGYKVFVSPKDVATKRGCLIYVREDLDTYKVETTKFTFVEHVQLRIYFKNRNRLLVSCIYRSPSVTDQKCIKEPQEILSTTKIGKINYDSIYSWEISTSQK